MKQKFLQNGFDHDAPPHEVLEMLLFFCVQRKDTNQLAHQLINKYGTLCAVLDAPVNELIQFEGITENNVVLLKMIMPVARFYNYEKRNQSISFNNHDEIGDFLMGQFEGFVDEHFCVLALGSNGDMLRFKCIADGDPASVGVSTRDLIKMAIDTGCSSMVIAHNHPSGVALPSAPDVELTKMIAAALSHVNVRLIDHIIVTDGDYVSMAQSERYHDIFNRRQ